MICPQCDALCMSAAYQEAKAAKDRIRTRPLLDELGTVFGYPFSDKTAFVLLAVFVGVFSVAASFAVAGAGLAILLSQGLLYAYAFTAINRVSSGDLGSFMPNVADPADLAQPLRVGLAALLISTGPLLALAFLHPPADVLQALGAPAAFGGAPKPSPSPGLSPELSALREAAASGNDAAAEPADADANGEAPEAAPAPEPAALALHEPAFEEPGIPRWVFFAYALAILWKVVYSPVALVAAAISRSFLATLNPLAGLGAISRMGSIYWTAMAVYTAIALVEVATGRHASASSRSPAASWPRSCSPTPISRPAACSGSLSSREPRSWTSTSSTRAALSRKALAAGGYTVPTLGPTGEAE